jgi:Arc/MetJ-type ribon-helix-helix transcriptional regulator
VFLTNSAPMADPEIKITLPLSVWRVVTAHLETGRYCEVSDVLHAIYVQGQPQIEAAELEAARVAEEQRSGNKSAELLKAVIHAKLN